MNRLSIDDLRWRLREANVWSKKELGQHFLLDGNVLDAIIEAADLKAGEKVLEIGPGLGVLTERLLATGASVTACEYDPDMQRILAEDFPDLDLERGDALRLGAGIAERLGEYAVVANIPYQITTPLMKLFLEGGVPNPPNRMVLLMQKEVAERLAASPGNGDRGYLSVLSQYYSTIDYICSVPPEAFWPAPEVDSAVIRMVRRTDRPAIDEQKFFKQVKSLFLTPRKQLRNVLASRTADAGTLLEKAGIPANARAHELSESDWVRLTDLL